MSTSYRKPKPPLRKNSAAARISTPRRLPTPSRHSSTNPKNTRNIISVPGTMTAMRRSMPSSSIEVLMESVR